MVDDIRLKRYDSITEAVEAASWILISRPYLGFEQHPFFDSFGRELDAGGLANDPLSNQHFLKVISG